MERLAGPETPREFRMDRRSRTIVHLSLGLGMLGVVVAAGLSPNTGVVQASSNCTYGQCVSSSAFPLWAVASSVAAVVVALLLAFLLLRRRRRPGQPPSEWEGPQGTGGGAPPGATGSGGQGPYETAAAGAAAPGVAGEMTPAPVWHEGTTEPGAPTEGVPVYEEPPAPPPEPAVAPPPSPTPAAPTAGPAPPAEEAEPDIDSLMAELEKISGEILKQKPKRKNGSPPPDTPDDPSS